MRFIRSLTLKVKLLALLVLLTSVMLGVYAALALKDFTSDKEAYVFDSILSQSKSIAVQVRSEIEFVADQIRFFMDGYDGGAHKFHAYKSYLFPSDKLFSALLTYRWNDQVHQYELATQLKQTNLSSANEEKMKEGAKALVNDVLAAELAMRELASHEGKWLVGLRYKIVGQERPLVVVALVNKGSFLEAFAGMQLQDTYLLSHNGEVIFSPMTPSYPTTAETLSGAIRETTTKLVAPAVTLQHTSPEGEKWLVSAARVNAGNMKVMSYLPKTVALEAARILIIKSGLFLGVLICLTVFVSVITANRLTEALKKLFTATKEVSQGNFNVEVKVQSEDEIGVVAHGFNQMTREIKRLMAETAEKARMESELQTASLVQSTLFPEPAFENDRVSIKGFYQPASECGGDWWYYTHTQGRTFFWIGDATGHGVPAALVTSAARSAMGVIDNFPELPLPQIMSMMNKSIFGAAKGQVLMTFFVGCLEHKTGKFTYCNASHDPPYLIRSKAGELKKKDLEVLMDNRGARFGESEKSEYTVSELNLKAGDRILFYTDGVTELHNDKNEVWGEREFIKSFLQGCSQDQGLNLPMQKLSDGISEFRNGAPLKDDVTYFMCQVKSAA